MDFSLNEDQRAFQDMAAAFARDEMEPYARDWDEKSFFPVETLRKAAALGFGGIYVREDVGGSALTRLDAAIIFEELAKGCTSTAAYISIHNMAAWMIDTYGADDLRRTYLPDLCSMTRFASYCLTEPGAGSDAASLRTRAVDDGDHYILNGSKAFISGGGVSDVYVTMVRTGGEGPKGISCVVIDKDTPGLSFGAQEAKLGWKSQPTAQVQFDDCKIPANNLVGEEGKGFATAMQSLDNGRLSVAAASCGYAKRILDTALKYSMERKAFGEPISQFQLIQAMLADSRAELYAAECMLRDASERVNRGKAIIEAASAKMFASEMCNRVADRCVQIHGGAGYLAEYDAERFYRDSRIYTIYEGTTQILQLVIAKNMLREFEAGVPA